MSVKHKDTDYLFLSARIRSLERTLLTRQQLERMLESGSVQEAARVLTDLGWEDFDAASPSALNRALLHRREQVFRELGQFMTDPAVLDVFKLKYDYHNVKTVIKSHGQGAELLVDAGRMDPKELLRKYQERGKWDFLPGTMDAAAQDAERILAETGDPQLADFRLDRAYFEELLSLAESTKCAYLVEYVRAMIDAANLRSLVRTLRMHKDAAFLRRVLFEGGTVSVSELMRRGPGGNVAELFRSTALRDAAAAGEQAVGGGSLTEFEKLCDDAVLLTAGKARRVPFGVEVAIGYVAAREAELTAVRIVMSGLMAGIPAGTIRERLRESYV